MRLRRFSLRNYRAWADVDLDFTTMPGAVITGPNGSGKSSIAEGIVWVPFGESRSSRITGVVRKGATDCVGELEFTATGETYKIVRKISVRGSGTKSELDLFRLANDTSPIDGVHGVRWEPISGKGARETQAEIRRILGIEYDTLLSASVMMQNDANRLTRAKPEERRDILRRSLDLGRWRTWLDRARAGSRDATAKREEANARAATIAAGLRAMLPVERPVLTCAPDDHLLGRAFERTDLGEAWTTARAHSSADAVHEVFAMLAQEASDAVVLFRGRRDMLREKEGAALAEQQRAQAALEAAQAAARNVDEARRRVEALDGEIAAARARFNELAGPAAELDAAVKAEADLPGAREKLTEAEATLVQVREAQGKLDGLVAERKRLVELWQAASGRHKAADAEAAGLADAEAAAGRIEGLRMKLDEAQQALDAASEAVRTAEAADDDARAEQVDEATAATTRAAFTRAQQAHLDAIRTATTADGDLSRARADTERLARAAERLAQAPCAVPGVTSWRVEGVDEQAPLELLTESKPCNLAGTCPLISDAVAARDALPAARAKLAEAEAAYTAAAELSNVAGTTLTAAQAEANKAEQARVAAHTDLRQRQTAAAAARRDALQAESTARSALDTARNALAKAERDSATVDAKRAAAERARTEADEVARLAREGASVRGKIDELGTPNVPAAEAAVTTARATVASCEATAGKRAAAELAISQRGDIERQIARLEAERTERAAEVARASSTDEQAMNAIAAEQSLTEARAAREGAEKSVTEAERVHARAEAVLEDVARRAEQARGEQETAAMHAETARVFDRTAEACALAPTLVIEKAIPVLEAEANRVLGAISTRGMRLRIDTQATTEDGGQREVMRFVVTDDVGEREYEDFSGGEQFRIDIALRLGLARLLADREGVPVEWLLIDEGGFGALDVNGLDALKDTVTGLQRLYPLVLVVTHIDAVADCLPRRIEVRPSANGSALEVM
jgi:exonuclease SbcC